MTRTPGREVGCPRRRGRSPARAEASGSLEGGVRKFSAPPERPPRPRRCRAGPEVWRPTSMSSPRTSGRRAALAVVAVLQVAAVASAAGVETEASSRGYRHHSCAHTR